MSFHVIAVVSAIWLGLATPARAAGATANIDVRFEAPLAPQLWTQLSYCVVVSNAGPASASAIILAHEIPAELRTVFVSTTQGSHSVSNQLLRCELGVLPAGSLARAWVDVSLETYNAGWISMEAMVTAEEHDPDASNNTATAAMRLGGPDLTAFFQPLTNEIRAAVPFQIVLTVTNQGPTDAHDVGTFSSGSVTRRCWDADCAVWSDFLMTSCALSQGEVLETRYGGIPWTVNFGTVATGGSASMTLTLIPMRTGKLSFSGSVWSSSSDREENDYFSLGIDAADGPGFVEFAKPRISVRENIQQAPVEILRRDGAQGAISVAFSTEDFTAVAGRDYAPEDFVLAFAHGETSKTFPLSILNNTQSDCNRQFKLSLRDTTGGALIYGVSNATLFITDDDLVPSGSLEAVGVPPNGVETGYGGTAFSSISADGRWLAFGSWDTNFATGDTNMAADVFVKDLDAGTIRLVSINRFGSSPGNAGSSLPVISADGGHVVFFSGATDLVTNNVPPSTGQIYSRNLLSGTTKLVSVTSDGTGADAGTSLLSLYTIMGVSSNGQIVAFLNDGQALAPGNPLNRSQLFVRNLLTEETILVTRSVDGAKAANRETRDGSLSADGRYIVFSSPATDLVSGKQGGFYLRDLTSPTNTYVAPGWGPIISADGRFVAFRSTADGLVIGDDNTETDAFVRDLLTGVTRRASAGLYGPCYSPSISADGRFVVFVNNLPGTASSHPSSQIYVHDWQSGATETASMNCHGDAPSNGACINAAIAPNGRYVFFQSVATDLAPGEFGQLPFSRETGLNVFRRDLQTRTTVLVSQNRDLTGGSAMNSGVATQRAEWNITPDGDTAIIVSEADDLVYEDSNRSVDLFIWRADGRRESGPRLTVSRESSDVVVRWPSGASNFLLQSAPNLSTAWTNVPVNGATELRTLPLGQRFFRLTHP